MLPSAGHGILIPMAVIPDEQYDWQAAHERLSEELDRGFPDPWMPEPGDELFGVVTAMRDGVPTQYGPCPVVEIVRFRGKEPVSVWLYSTVLRRAFERENVQPGETVLIRYQGKSQPDGGGNAYHHYALRVDRPHTKRGFDWRAVADRYGDDVDELRNPVPARPPRDDPDDWHLRGEPFRDEEPAGGGSDADDIPF